MEWTVLFDDDFAAWLDTVDEALRIKIAAHVELIEKVGPNLGRPKVDGVKESTYPNMKELRIQYRGAPWRILFAFDPERNAVFLVGGNKGPDARWYVKNIPIADKRFGRHLESLNRKKR